MLEFFLTGVIFWHPPTSPWYLLWRRLFERLCVKLSCPRILISCLYAGKRSFLCMSEGTWQITASAEFKIFKKKNSTQQSSTSPKTHKIYIFHLQLKLEYLKNLIVNKLWSGLSVFTYITVVSKWEWLLCHNLHQTRNCQTKVDIDSDRNICHQ